MYQIRIPPLRERQDDILPLATHFLNIHAKANNKNIKGLAPDLAESLLHAPFHGNVRELENMIAAAVLLEKGRNLTTSSVRNLMPYRGPERRKNVELLSLDELEKRHIEKVLKVTGGNRPKAAKILGVNVTTVYRKIEKYNLK
jgi:DNA-binding NtrC family response regulator